VETIRELLTADGRSLAQGALGWCLGQSDRTIPLPGCRTPEQARDNFGVLDIGPLPDEILRQVQAVMLSDFQA
jgi:aryl-alcohol dehydrogenase-like predicted oxidoreductase